MGTIKNLIILLLIIVLAGMAGAVYYFGFYEKEPPQTQTEDGIDGADGKDGIDGINGTNGIDGQDGKDGVDGINGINGTNGIDGKDGADGKNGVDGVNGIDGLHGADGAKGDKGEPGEKGENGTDGVNGLDGLPGKDGINGTNGINGADTLIYGGIIAIGITPPIGPTISGTPNKLNRTPVIGELFFAIIGTSEKNWNSICQVVGYYSTTIDFKVVSLVETTGASGKDGVDGKDGLDCECNCFGGNSGSGQIIELITTDIEFGQPITSPYAWQDWFLGYPNGVALYWENDEFGIIANGFNPFADDLQMSVLVQNEYGVQVYTGKISSICLNVVLGYEDYDDWGYYWWNVGDYPVSLNINNWLVEIYFPNVNYGGTFFLYYDGTEVISSLFFAPSGGDFEVLITSLKIIKGGSF